MTDIYPQTLSLRVDLIVADIHLQRSNLLCRQIATEQTLILPFDLIFVGDLAHLLGHNSLNLNSTNFSWHD